MLCNSGFVDDIVFSHNGTYSAWRWQYQRESRSGHLSSHKFTKYSPGGAILFDFVVVYCVRQGVSNDVMLGAASGRWPAACGIVKAGG